MNSIHVITAVWIQNPGASETQRNFPLPRNVCTSGKNKMTEPLEIVWQSERRCEVVPKAVDFTTLNLEAFGRQQK